MQSVVNPSGEKTMGRLLHARSIALTFWLAFLLFRSVCFAEVIDVQIKGIDDGIKTSKQQDYKEAVLFAKREAIERAGVEIASETTVKDLMIHEDLIESKAKALLLPGYSIVDIGYTEDGEYTVMLIGKVRTDVADQGENTEEVGKTSDADHPEPAKDTEDQGDSGIGHTETDEAVVPYKPAALLTVKTVPAGAFVSLDGKFLSRSPVIKAKVTPGKHRLSIMLKGYYRRSMDITMLPDDPPANHFELHLMPVKRPSQQEHYPPSPPRPKPFKR